MTIKTLGEGFSICKINDVKDADFSDTLCFVSKTDEEVSLVCHTSSVPATTVAREDDFSAMRIEGVLDLELVGILSTITSLLAAERIAVFAVSTYNTDYIFVKSSDNAKAIKCLDEAGYVIA